MEDQPNYQPQDGSQGLPVEEPPKALPKPLKSSSKTVLITVVLVIVTALVAAGATWYYMDSQQKDQQASNQKQVEQLKTYASTLKNQATEAKPSITPSVTPATTKNDVEELRTFCKGTDPNTEVGPVVYYENGSEQYGDCSIGVKNQPGGARLTAYKKDGKWTKIVVAQENLSKTMCLQYKIPGAIGGCAESYKQ